MRKKFRIEKKILEEREKEREKPKNFALPLATHRTDDLVSAYLYIWEEF